MICPRVPGSNVICVLFRQDWGNASGVRISCQEQVIEIKQAMRPGGLDPYCRWSHLSLSYRVDVVGGCHHLLD